MRQHGSDNYWWISVCEDEEINRALFFREVVSVWPSSKLNIPRMVPELRSSYYVELSGEDYEAVAQDWNIWWSGLLMERDGGVPRRDERDRSHDERDRSRTLLENMLPSQSKLRSLVQENARGFIEWAARRSEVSRDMARGGDRDSMAAVVSEVIDDVGGLTSIEFSLRITLLPLEQRFVHWPSSRHILMTHSMRNNVVDLRTTLQPAIRRLVQGQVE